MKAIVLRKRVINVYVYMNVIVIVAVCAYSSILGKSITAVAITTIIIGTKRTTAITAVIVIVLTTKEVTTTVTTISNNR